VINSDDEFLINFEDFQNIVFLTKLYYSWFENAALIYSNQCFDADLELEFF